MKIPTLLGIALILAIAVSAFFYFYYKKPPPASDFIVSDLQVVNIFETSSTIVWQTKLPTIGQVLYSENENTQNKAKDVRDQADPVGRLVHFVNIDSLKPNTKYFYRIQNNGVNYSDKVLEFKTASQISTNSDELYFSFIKPLKGTILNTNLNTIDESLIFLKIPGANNLATFSSTSGNFILPLKKVLNQDLNDLFSIAQKTPAELIIKKGDLEAKVKILISDETTTLPPIPIGANLDLSNFKPKTISIIKFSNSKANFDFNSDGKINSLDLAILREKTQPKNPLTPSDQTRFDLNSDGFVSQDDINIFSKALIGN